MSSATIRHRVLVVTATFPPDAAVGSLRTLRLLKHLAQTGWDPEVLTIDPATYRPGSVTDPAALARVPSEVRVTHARALRPVVRLIASVRRPRAARTGASAARPAVAPAHPSRDTGPVRRLQQVLRAVFTLPDADVSWILPALVTGLRRARAASPDVIYSSGPPFSAHVVAAGLAALLKRPWVADFRDPWARAPWRDDRFAFEKRAWSVFESLIVRRADAVLFVTEANRDDFAAHYGAAAAARFHVVPNGCDLSDFESIEPGPEPEQFVLLHAGSLYGARDPSPLFRAAAEAVAGGAVDRRRFRIRLIGRMAGAELALSRLVRDLGIEDVVEFAPHAPRAQVLQQMVDASALLVVQPVTRLSVPGKLYEYLAAGRPVLALAEPDGETAAVLRRTPAGVVVAPADHEGLLRALVEMTAAGRRRIHTDPSLYDGALRAGELAARLRMVLPDVGHRGTPARGVVPVPTKRP